ncbi:hypothetical protein VP1G_08623 [Cytospora mali]|uniref:Uncharacterized protein n=1 Tax=Cytospora mali TaxID=578113 RepID=A0A194VC43_CYTMA|nr:hypothetical protein VP1G_08623 [Valsa mali var. pyri (nom. inval.)]
MWTGNFSDGSTLHTVYTGFSLLDFPLSLTPTFWTPALAQASAIKLLSTTLYAALQSLAAWGTIEVFRLGQKPAFLRWAPALICLWMYTGTALFVPFYCYYDLTRHFNTHHRNAKPSDPSVGYYQAVCIPAAALLCYIWPYYVMHYPPHGTTSSLHQTILAFNIFGGLLCYVLVLGGASFLAPAQPAAIPGDIGSEAPWIKATYAMLAIFSLSAHFEVVGDILWSQDRSISFSSVFVPDFWVGIFGSPTSLESRMAPEVHFFLQWDFLIFVFSTSVWATRIVEAMYCDRKDGWAAATRAGLILAFSLGGLLLNPGCVLSVLLYIREDFLRKEYMTSSSQAKVLAGKESSS